MQVQAAPARLDDETIARQELGAAIVARFEVLGLNNTHAAAAAGIPRRDVIRLRKGEVERFTLGWLMKAHAAVTPGARVRLVVEPA
jgi:predicted XRE-type DNA-binding protein